MTGDSPRTILSLQEVLLKKLRRRRLTRVGVHPVRLCVEMCRIFFPGLNGFRSQASQIQKLAHMEPLIRENNFISKYNFVFKRQKSREQPKGLLFGSELENPSSESKVMMISRLRWWKKIAFLRRTIIYDILTRSLFAVSSARTPDQRGAD